MWSAIAEIPQIGADEVHVWRADLDLPPSVLDRLRQVLAEDELERAARFVSDKHRRRSLAARGQLRRLLSGYVDVPAGALRFRYGPYGKPSLQGSGEGLWFNVSHSDAVTLFAVTRAGAVGVDVERMRPDISHLAIAERFFSPRERAVLRSLPAEAQVSSFFACWTRKEAYLKATGLGLSLPLDSFEVSLAPADRPALTCTAFIPPEGPHWCVHSLEVGRDYAGAVVVQGSGCRVRTFALVPPAP